MKYGARFRYKRIFQYNLEGNLINIYSDLNQMHEITGYRKDYISAACRHTYPSANGYLWIYEDESETIENLLSKIPISHIVEQYDKSGKLIAEYSSCSAAAKAMKCSKSHISRAINNYNLTACGYYWKNKNDSNSIEERIKNHENCYKDRERKILQLDKDGNILNEYKSIQAAAEAMGKPACRSAIGKVCQGKQKTSCGYRWAYAEV